MNRRRFLLLTVFLGLVPGAALADYGDRIARRLKSEGYTEISVSRTLLGRVRIVARRGRSLREIVLNPKTGEILRDVWLEGDDGEDGGRGGHDDDDHDDDDDDDDDDNSGHGGGGGDHDDDDDDDDDDD